MESTPKPRIRLHDFLALIQFQSIPKWLIIFVLLLSLVQTIGSLIIPWFTKDLVDGFTGDTDLLNRYTLYLIISAFLLQGIASALATYSLSYLAEKVVSQLRKRLWKKVLTLPVTYFDQNRSGDTVSRITNDTTMVKDLITNQLIPMFSGIISIIGALFALFYLDWSMTLVMLVAIPTILLVIHPLGRFMYKISKNIQQQTANFTSILTQVISEIRLMKSYVAESYEKENGEQVINHLFRFGLKEAKIYSILQPIIGLITMLMLVLIIGFGGMRVASGALSSGELVAYILYLFQIVMPVSLVAQFFTRLQKAMGAMERLKQIMEHESEPSNESTVSIDPQSPITFNQVEFAYPQSEKVLNNVSFTIEPGTTTAIVGPSGSGKTTLFSLLLRFYEPTSGQIRLGDTPITEFALKDWRSLFGYVSQESPLIAGTVRDNICYGMRRKIDDNELVQAAKLANAHEFILQLPHQYDTEVGERGIMLSGGQRQRIAIARAFLHDPKILMLDEATSNLDSTSEQSVQKSLAQLMVNRTTLVVAHRLSTVVDADQIIVLENGKITGIGKHHSLIDNHPLYRQMVEHQFQWGRENIK